MANSAKTKIGLAIGGEGVRGAVGIGFYEVLKENGIPVSAIAGTSMGAIMASAIALDYPTHAMKAFLQHYNDLNILGFDNFNYFNEGIIKRDSLERLIKNFFGGKTFAETKMHLACTSVDLESRKEFVIKDGSVALATQAASAYPVLFPPVFYKERYLVDGALINPVPVDVLRDMGAEKIIAIKLHSNTVRQHIAGHIFMKHYKDKMNVEIPGKEENDSKKSFIGKMFKETFGQKYDDKKDDLKFMIDILMESLAIAGQGTVDHRLEKSGTELLLEQSVEVGWMDFDRMDKLVELGRKLAMDSLPTIKGWLE